MAKGQPTRTARFRFRWKYAFSAFLVFGVLSLTIGKNQDPIILQGAALEQEFVQIFLINKDEKTATQAELDGPKERTFPLDSPVLTAFVKKLAAYGRYVSQQSFARAAQPKIKISDPRMLAVAKGAQVYEELLFGIYRNYMRLAHDADFKTYRTTGVFLRGLEGVFLGADAAMARDYERWKSLNQDVIAAAGARQFSPGFYDVMNIRLDPKTGQILYTDKSYKKIFNIRNVKGETGDYTQVELFVTSFEKQMAEYEAIANPNSKEEYLKLLQFAAIREAMSNRWAIRRMGGSRSVASPRTFDRTAVADATRVARPVVKGAFPVGNESPESTVSVPVTFSDAGIRACAPDLVSFRPKGKGSFSVNDLEAYSSLWQQDRHGDLMALGAEAAAAATKEIPLLTDREYGEMFGVFIGSFKAFQTDFLTKFGSDTNGLVDYLASVFGPTVKKYEETKWSSDVLQQAGEKANPNEPGIPTSVERFIHGSFPADDLSIPAVAERYADQAYMMRLYYMAEGLQFAAHGQRIATAPAGASEDFFEVSGVSPQSSNVPTVQQFPETNTPASFVHAMDVAKSYMAPRADAWKKMIALRVQTALQAKLGMSIPTPNGNSAGLGFLRGQDLERYNLYAQDVMPFAAMGANGVQVRRAAEAAQDALHRKMLSARECTSPPTPAGVTAPPTCFLKYTDPKTVPVKDQMAPGWYLGYAPFRNPARLLGFKDLIIPETADQLSQFFKKKINAVLSYDNAITQYAEPKIVEDIARNEVVLRGVDLFFGALAGAADPGAADGAADAKASCTSTNTAVGKKGTTRRTRKPASGAGELTPEECSKPTNSEAETRRNALEAALVPTAKKAYADFIKGLSTEGTYKYPERAAKALEAKQKAQAEAFKAFTPKPFVAVQDNLSMRNVNPRIAKLQDEERRREDQQTAKANAAKVAENSRRAAENRRQHGYFRPGQDHALDKTGGELYLKTDAERKEAIRLYVEAMGMLGLSEDILNTTWVPRPSNDYFPGRIRTWTGTEHVLRAKLAGVRPLERIVATVSDQMAMGQVFGQEAIAHAPILTLQDEWRWKRNEKKSPILVEKLASAWSPDRGFGDGREYHQLFRSMLSRASSNDVGKIETFCKADIKSYRDDENFRTMFMAIGGIRDMLGTDEQMRKWDAEILKESRTWGQAFMEDYIDPYSVPLMIAILLVVVIQVVATVMTGGGALALTGNLFVGVARFIFLQMTGNLGIVTLIFSFQTYLMVSTYHFKMPPQLAFTFQLANSRIQNMQEGRFAGAAMVDREKLGQLREELNSQQLMTNIAIVGEIVQFAGFTVPGVARTLGFTGAKKMVRLASASSPEVLAGVQTASLAQMIRQKGFAAGVREYWEKAGPALKNLRRIATVQAGKNLETQIKTSHGLVELLGDKVGSMFKDKAELRKVYEFLRDENRREAELLLHGNDELTTKAIAESLRRQPVNLHAIREQVDRLTAEARRRMQADAYRKLREARNSGASPKQMKAVLEGLSTPEQQEAILLVQSKQWEEELYRAAIGELGPTKSEARLLSKIAKAEEFLAGEKEFQEYIDALDRSVAGGGRTDIQNFFTDENRFNPSRLEKHRNYFKKAKDVLSEDARKGIKKAYKDYEYLHEDWEKVSPDARAIGEFYRSGKYGMYINENGELALLDPKEYRAHPEKFSVSTLPLLRLYPELLKSVADEAEKAAK